MSAPAALNLSTASLDREAKVARLTQQTFDVVIVGGGATGAATARDAALRGLKTALFDVGDFASQTSSASSRLIHGGIRYLQYGNFGLVFEGLSERRRLMRTAPHLCRPVDFVFPAYQGAKPGLGMIGLGIQLYNALALWQKPSRRERLSTQALAQSIPLLRQEGLLGAQIYQDCQTDDARLVLENVLDAEAAGAICLNHAHATFPERSGNRFITTITDRLAGGRITTIAARTFVNATGPFSDAFEGTRRLRPTLGVHIVVDAQRLPTHGKVLVLNSPRDGRLFFILPAGARTAIGTTDTDWRPSDNTSRAAHPSDPITARKSDVAYLLEAANVAFPSAALTPADVISTWAGLRPLVAALDASPSATSREHELFFDEGSVTIVGGKLTTMRKMGEQIVDKLCHFGQRRGLSTAPRRCVTRTRLLPGAAPLETSPGARALAALPAESQAHLTSRYGTRAPLVADLTLHDPSLAERIEPDLNDLWAEVVFSARHEHAMNIEDVFRRRLSVFRNGRDQGLNVVERAAALIAKEHPARSNQKSVWIQDYRSAVALTRRWATDA